MKAANAIPSYCLCILEYGILSKAQQKLVLVLYITKQKLVFSIVVLASFIARCLSLIM